VSIDWSTCIANLLAVLLYMLFGKRLQRDSEEWLESFTQWQEYERWRMSELEDLYERLGEWTEVADRIDRGEHPYNNLTDALTQQMDKFAHGMITHLEWRLAKLKEEDHPNEH
jgi:hypothetical protein